VSTITETAFLARVRRRLRQEGERLVVARRVVLDYTEFRYMAVDDRNCIAGGWNAIGEMVQHWARPAGIVAPHERVGDWSV
jgi:hypothetical protein